MEIFIDIFTQEYVICFGQESRKERFLETYLPEREPFDSPFLLVQSYITEYYLREVVTIDSTTFANAIDLASLVPFSFRPSEPLSGAFRLEYIIILSSPLSLLPSKDEPAALFIIPQPQKATILFALRSKFNNCCCHHPSNQSFLA
jgi:hypothetical protein